MTKQVKSKQRVADHGEVFTAEREVKAMCDLVADECLRIDSRFLDPACKSGVFLREIAKRLIDGLAPQFPDLQERLDHIFHKQLFGIAITDLTAMLSRRSLYCTKCPESEYSVTKFDSNHAGGNILFRNIKHTWRDGRCIYCGTAQKSDLGDKDRGVSLETHAYEWIHTIKPEEIWGMNFDVIISNPPYQLKVNESGKGLGAVPIYQKFVQQAQRLKPRYISMIIPARWFSGGVGLEEFRQQMLSNKHISKIVDYVDSKDCFPGVDVNGGICYFLMDKSYSGNCEYTNISNGKSSHAERDLNEFDIYIRRNEAVSIVHKVLAKSNKMISAPGGCSPQTPYGFLSTYVGMPLKTQNDDCELLSSKGWTYVHNKDVLKARETISLYKPMISKLSCEHAGNPDKSGMFRVLSRMEILKPNQICSQSYLTVCPCKTENEANNIFNYLRTKFVRFLILQTLAGMNLSINNFKFVPWLDFTEEWTDEKLYARFEITPDEIAFIDELIRPMDVAEN